MTRTRRSWRGLLHAAARRLLAPTDGVTLALFRLGFAYVLFLQANKWRDVTDTLYRNGLLLSYPTFGWVPPPPPWLGDLETIGLQVLPFVIALGLYTRVALLLEFLCFTHIFIVCEVGPHRYARPLILHL